MYVILIGVNNATYKNTNNSKNQKSSLILEKTKTILTFILTLTTMDKAENATYIYSNYTRFPEEVTTIDNVMYVCFMVGLEDIL